MKKAILVFSHVAIGICDVASRSVTSFGGVGGTQNEFKIRKDIIGLDEIVASGKISCCLTRIIRSEEVRPRAPIHSISSNSHQTMTNVSPFSGARVMAVKVKSPFVAAESVMFVASPSAGPAVNMMTRPINWSSV